MDASVFYEPEPGRTFSFSAQVPEPPPGRHTFIDPKNGVSVEADLVKLDDLPEGGQFAHYRQVGLERHESQNE